MNLIQMKIFDEIEKALKSNKSEMKNLFESKDMTIDSLWLFNTNVENLVDGSIIDVISAFRKDMKKNEELVEAIYYLKTDRQNIVLEDIENKYPLFYEKLDEFFELTNGTVGNCMSDLINERLNLKEFIEKSVIKTNFSKYNTPFAITELLQKSESQLKNKIYNNANIYEYLLYSEERYLFGELASSIKNVKYDITKDNSSDISLSNAISSIGNIATVRVDKQGNCYLRKENGEIVIEDDSKSPKQRIYDSVEAKDEYIYGRTYYPKLPERDTLIKDIISLFNDIPYLSKIEIDSSVDLAKLKISLENIKRLNLPLENGIILRYRLTGKHNATGLYFDGLKSVILDITKSSSAVHELTHALDYAGFFKDQRKDFVKMNTFNNYEYASAFGMDTSYYNSYVEIVARGGEAAYALMEADIGNLYEAYINKTEYKGTTVTDKNFFEILYANSSENYKIIGKTLTDFITKPSNSVYFNLNERTPNELYGIYQTYEKAFGFKDVIQTKVFDNMYINLTGNNSEKRSYKKRQRKEGLDIYSLQDVQSIITGFKNGYVFEMELKDFCADVLLNTSNGKIGNKGNIITFLKDTLDSGEYKECIGNTKDVLNEVIEDKTGLYEIIYQLVDNGVISKDEYKKFSVINSLEDIIDPLRNGNFDEVINYVLAIKNYNGIYYFDKDKTGDFDSTINFMKTIDTLNQFYRKVNNEVGFSAKFDLTDDSTSNQFNNLGKVFISGEDTLSLDKAMIPFLAEDGKLKAVLLNASDLPSLRFNLVKNENNPVYESLTVERNGRSNVLTLPYTNTHINLRDVTIVDNVEYDNQRGLIVDGKEFGEYITNINNFMSRTGEQRLYDKRLQGFIYPNNNTLNSVIANSGLVQLQSTYNKNSKNSRNSHLFDIQDKIDTPEKLELVEKLYNSTISSSLNESEFEKIKFNFLKSNQGEDIALDYLKDVYITKGLDFKLKDMVVLRNNAAITSYYVDSLGSSFENIGRRMMNSISLTTNEKLMLRDKIIEGVRPLVENILSKTDIEYLENEKETLILMLEHSASSINVLNNSYVLKNDSEEPLYETKYVGKLFVSEIFNGKCTQAEIITKLKELVEKDDKKSLKQIFSAIEVLKNSYSFNPNNKGYYNLDKNTQKLLSAYEKTFEKGTKSMKEYYDTFCELSKKIEENELGNSKLMNGLTK